MVVDTTYYDALGVPPSASELDIKKAYRKQAIKLHPDKNPGDETAHAKFQVVGEAYQVLSNSQLRAAYDKFGPEKAQPREGFEDPAEFFGMIFGGESFTDLIGELSLMKDLTKTMDITTREEEAAAASQASVHAPPSTSAAASPGTPSGSAHQQSTVDVEKSASLRPDDASAAHTPASRRTPSPSHRTTRIPTQQLLMEKEEDATLDAAGMTEEEKELRKAERRKGGLSREQRAELDAYEAERRRIRQERVDSLARKLQDRVSIWTETDHGSDVTFAFESKTKLEAENLKMESFGIELLHAVGFTYVSKATSFLKSQKFLGISGFFSRLKDKGNVARETWQTLSTAIDAQMTMEEMAKLEERGGQDWTDERKAEYERLVTGKILAAAWKGSKFEIQGVLRDVCDKLLHDRSVSLEKRVQRAHALNMVGNIFLTTRRDPDEESEYMVFEQLMADAAKKRERQRPSAGSKNDPPHPAAVPEPNNSPHHGTHAAATSAGAAPQDPAAAST